MHRSKPEYRVDTQNDLQSLENKRQIKLRQMMKERNQQAAEMEFLNQYNKIRKIAATQPKVRENVKFKDCLSRNTDATKLPKKNFKNFNHEMTTVSNRAKLCCSSDEDVTEENVVYNNFVYNDNESETESLFDPEEYTRQTLNDMETKMNDMTDRFIHRVKSEVDETFSKLKLQQKLKLNKGKRDVKTKIMDRGDGGDTIKQKQKTCEEDITFNLLQQRKMQAYLNIDQNLKVLQHVDQLAGQLYNNHLSNLKKD